MSNNPKIVSELSSNAVLGGQDTCQGDSGGPLWTVVDGRAVLIGTWEVTGKDVRLP